MAAPYTPASVTDAGDFGDAWNNPGNATARDASPTNNLAPEAASQVWSLKLVVEGSVLVSAPDESLPVAFPSTNPTYTNQDFTFSGLSITGAQLKASNSGFDFRTGGNLAEGNTLQIRDFSGIGADVPDGNVVSEVVCRLNTSNAGTTALVDVVEIQSVTHAPAAASMAPIRRMSLGMGVGL